MTRFQNCNKITQLWRLRWYCAIPFMWTWHMTVKPFKVGLDEMVDGKIQHTDKFEIIRGKDLWSLLKGIVQGKMKWFYTHEEVMDMLNEKTLRTKSQGYEQ